MTAEIPSKGRRRPAAKPAAEPVTTPATTTDEVKGITPKKGRTTPSRRQSDSEPEVRRGFFGNLVDYIQGVRAELDKVAWPSREQVISLFRIVIVVTVVAAIVLGLISLAFNELFNIGLQNPIVFVIFGAVVAGLTFFVMRRNAEAGPSR